MAKKPPRRRRPTTGAAAASPADADAPQGTPAPQGQGYTVSRSSRSTNDQLLRRLTLGVIIGVFVVSLVGAFTLFQSGETIQWKRDLALIEGQFERGNVERAAQQLAQFGKDWPGATETVGWNQQMGRYNAAAEKWEIAARHYVRASELDPKAPGLHSAAGEAYYKAGDRKKAEQQLRAELKDIGKALADADRAHYYLGMLAMDQGNFKEAFEHFQAVRDREQWQAELAAVYEKLDSEILAPAQHKAESSSVEELVSAAP